MKSHTRKSKTMKTMKKRGGNYATGAPLSAQAYYVPEYVSSDDCAIINRPGAILSNPNPALAQTVMAGGQFTAPAYYPNQYNSSYKGMNNCKAMAPYGSIQSNPRPNLAQIAMGGRRSSRRTRKGGCGCGIRRGGGRSKGSKGSKSSKNRKLRKTQRGGRYMVDTSSSIGGDGPVMVPTYSSIPCEGHVAMPINPVNPATFVDNGNPEINMHGVRPAFIQAGGNPVAGSHPLAYEAPRAGFSFYPNIAQGEPLQPGLVPYQNVIPQQAPCTTGCGQAIAAINKH